MAWPRGQTTAAQSLRVTSGNDGYPTPDGCHASRFSNRIFLCRRSDISVLCACRRPTGPAFRELGRVVRSGGTIWLLRAAGPLARDSHAARPPGLAPRTARRRVPMGRGETAAVQPSQPRNGAKQWTAHVGSSPPNQASVSARILRCLIVVSASCVAWSTSVDRPRMLARGPKLDRRRLAVLFRDLPPGLHRRGTVM
jgi:hypothetical protein